jgi:hypothetical protein
MSVWITVPVYSSVVLLGRSPTFSTFQIESTVVTPPRNGSASGARCRGATLSPCIKSQIVSGSEISSCLRQREADRLFSLLWIAPIRAATFWPLPERGMLGHPNPSYGDLCASVVSCRRPLCSIGLIGVDLHVVDIAATSMFHPDCPRAWSKQLTFAKFMGAPVNDRWPGGSAVWTVAAPLRSSPSPDGLSSLRAADVSLCAVTKIPCTGTGWSFRCRVEKVAPVGSVPSDATQP